MVRRSLHARADERGITLVELLVVVMLVAVLVRSCPAPNRGGCPDGGRW